MWHIPSVCATNCYFAINDDTREVLIIDPGASAKQLAEKVKEHGLTPRGILLTHGHFDHAAAAEELAQLLDVKIYAHEAEQETLETPGLNLSGWEGKAWNYHADVYLKDEQELARWLGWEEHARERDRMCKVPEEHGVCWGGGRCK